MYHFDGKHKSRPAQAYGGNSKGEPKDALLLRAQEERRKREAARIAEQSSTIIQSFYRGCKNRENTKSCERKLFDESYKALSTTRKELPLPEITKLCRQLIYFFNPSNDSQRLMLLCQAMVKQHSLIAKHSLDSKTPGLYQLTHILRICCLYLEFMANGLGPIAMPLRMLELFTNPDTFTAEINKSKARSIVEDITHYLISNHYYRCMRTLLVHKVPDSIELTLTPPTPLAGSLQELIKAPLNTITNSSNRKYKNAVLQSVCTQFFNQPYSPQIGEFLLPSLAYSYSTFPFMDLLHMLLTVCQPDNSLSGSQQKIDKQIRNTFEPTPWLLHSVLTLATNRIGQLSATEMKTYLLVLNGLMPSIQLVTDRHQNEADDSDDDEMDWNTDPTTGSAEETAQKCLRLINQNNHVDGILRVLTAKPDSSVLSSICTVCHALAAQNKFAVNSSRLMYTLAFNPVFMRNLWQACISVTATTVLGSQTSLLQSLSRGLELSDEDIRRFVPLLSVFCSLFTYSMLSLHDAEFYGEDTASKSFMPFALRDLVLMSRVLRDACLGIIELAHPETRPEVREEYKLAFQSIGSARKSVSRSELLRQQQTWSHLFKILSQLVKQLYARDSRRSFCPESHWLSYQVNIRADQPLQFFKNTDMFQFRPFGSLGAWDPNKKFSIEDGPPLSTKEARKLTILQELPFVVPFSERIKIFNRLVQQDRRDEQGGDMGHLRGNPSISLKIRRNYLYEDAYERLSVENEPNLRLRVQVQLINFAGANEAGIDGGGLFREFIWELLKTAFDPNRGFFKYTTDKQLYPNPHARLLNDDYRAHYFFLGRILGKALYEGMLVELPFAGFFLSKLLSRHRGNVDIDHLASLDPEMYKNLLYLKNYDGDVTDLDLDFTVAHNELGEVEQEELKPGGATIAVTNDNKVEYIHRMSDYMLNRRIRIQCEAFREGMSDVINIEWLRMFNHNEVQKLISGAPVPIDIEDLRRYTNYSGGYSDDHPVIRSFWQVVHSFSEVQRRQLLKFVTSCSRPPLLGFKDLFPAFCIHHAGKDPERLPTASTCMNLLKLPEVNNQKLMAEKLAYAVEAGAGFELS